MQLILFEDEFVNDLYPITLTRPAFDVVCGTGPLWHRHCHLVHPSEIAVVVRPELTGICKAAHPDWTVRETPSETESSTLLVNARWLPPWQSLDDLRTPRVGMIGDEIAYAILPAGALLDECRTSLPQENADGVLLRHPWQLVDCNAAALREDATRNEWTPFLFGSIEVVGPTNQMKVRGECHVEPHVVADTRKGPVLIDDGAEIHAFTRLEGPCYIGKNSIVLSAKIRGGSIGPQCRVGGEVEASIIHGHSNKYHDGFLGHSYIGEWVNLAAGTQTSDLRNDYGPITVRRNGQRLVTGLTKVGAFIGDHTKTGLNTLFNPGSVVGAFANILPGDSYVPKVVPSFCDVRHGSIHERTGYREMLQTANTVMQRRGCEWTETMTEFVYALYEKTAAERERVIRETEQKRWRRSA